MFAHLLSFLVLGLGRSVAAHDTNVCLFHLRSVDASNNNLTVGQLPGGQLQGSKATESATWFRLYNGRLLDQALRGCWWASGSSVLVCDVPFSDVEEPDQLFSVTMHGDDQALAYNGTFSFYACRAGRYGKVNYYLNQTDATCPQVCLHIDPDMACFTEPYFTTSTAPVFSFTTPIVPIPDTTITCDIVSTITVGLSTYTRTGTVGDDTSTTADTTGQIVFTTYVETTSTYTHTHFSTLPEPSSPPSSPPSTYTHPHSHSLGTVKTSLTTRFPLSPPLPSFSTLYPQFNSTLYIPPSTPTASDLSTIPYKSFTGFYSWINSSYLPSTLMTTAVSGGYSRGSVTTTRHITLHTTPLVTMTGPSKPSIVATTLVVHTGNAKGTGPVVETFTVTGEKGPVFTFAVEVDSS